ncbi:MAG: hypothetical protein IMZ64_13020 [Bacteroidetes bacterium]|nr:hypothetical protein [Bacteroidota bacterium]
MEEKTRLRAYFVRVHKDCEYGIAVIAENIKDAKKQGIESGDIGDIEEYIDVRAVWIKDANIEGLTEGVVDAEVDALKRGLYLYLEDVECPGCGDNIGHLENDNGIVLCEECKEKHIKENGPKP